LIWLKGFGCVDGFISHFKWVNFKSGAFWDNDMVLGFSSKIGSVLFDWWVFLKSWAIVNIKRPPMRDKGGDYTLIGLFNKS
jgi:hypothetical protein